MAKKLIVSDNYLTIIDTVTNETIEYPTYNVRYKDYGNNFIFNYINDSSQNVTLQFSEIVDENGNSFGSKDALIQFLRRYTGGQNVNLSTCDIGRSAWGLPKFSQDKSIIHGMFTFNVPVNVWKETFNGTIRDITNATSVDGKLVLKAGDTLNDYTVLDTYRNPRYEPNRGLIYSNSLILPSPSALGNRQFGIFTDESGAFFSLESGDLYAVVRTTVQGVTSDDKYLIDTTGIDLSKGNIYDIQMQWRGVGNYKFFINLTEVKKISYLGTRTELTMYNPANPIAFVCENLGNNVEMHCGCVDVSTEGGMSDGKSYGSIGIDNETGSVSVTGYNQPVIAVRSKSTVGGKRNTRDTVALMASAYADQKAVFRIWQTRDFTAITENNQTWSDFGDGHLEYIVYDTPDVATPMTFDTTKATLVWGGRVGLDETYESSALFGDKADIYLTPSEMFIFTVHRENGTGANVGVTFEFAEEI